MVCSPSCCSSGGNPITRINSLLVVSSIPNIFEKVEGWLKELDKIPGEGSKLSVFVYYVQNAKAKDLAEVLKEVFTKGKEKKVEKGGTPAEATPRGARPAPTPPTPPAAAREEAGGVPEGEIGIVVDETTNSLIIKAFHRDYRAILETIKKLDIYPKQVLIEVFLAEVSLDDTNKFGIEWASFVSSHVTSSQAQGAVLGSQPPVQTTTDTLGKSSQSFRWAIRSLSRPRSRLLRRIRARYRLGLISNFYGNVATLCEEAGLASALDVILDSALVGMSKPDPGIFQAALKRFQLPPEEVICVGDSFERDMIPARELGMKTIWLKGPHPRIPENAGPVDASISSLSELEVLVS